MTRRDKFLRNHLRSHLGAAAPKARVQESPANAPTRFPVSLKPLRVTTLPLTPDQRQRPSKGPGAQKREPSLTGSQGRAADTHLGHGHLKHDVPDGLGGRARHRQQQHLHPGVAGGPSLGEVEQDSEAAAVAHDDGRQAACGEGTRHHQMPRRLPRVARALTPSAPTPAPAHHPEHAAALVSEGTRDSDEMLGTLRKMQDVIENRLNTPWIPPRNKHCWRLGLFPLVPCATTSGFAKPYRQPSPSQ